MVVVVVPNPVVVGLLEVDVLVTEVKVLVVVIEVAIAMVVMNRSIQIPYDLNPHIENMSFLNWYSSQ